MSDGQRGLRISFTSRGVSISRRTVSNWKFFEPPSALKPAADAIDSSSVDFPLPFSPMRNVTGRPNGIDSTPCSAGRSKGQPLPG